MSTALRKEQGAGSREKGEVLLPAWYPLGGSLPPVICSLLPALGSLLLAPCSLLALLAWATCASGQSVLLPASKTNTLIQVAGPTSQQLSNGLGDVFVGRTNQDGQGPATISIRRGLIAFDVTDNVPAGSNITGVTLILDDAKGMNGNPTITLGRMLRDWGQGTSLFDGGIGAPATNGDVTWYYTCYNAADPTASPTWAAPGGLAGVDFSSSISATALDVATGASNQSLSFSSTANPLMIADVQQWLDSPAANFGWIIFGNESAGQTAKRFGGQYATSPESPPQLDVQYDAPWNWTGGAGTTAWTASGNWTGRAGYPGSNAAIVLGGSATGYPLAGRGTVDLGSARPSVSHLTFDADKTVAITSTAAGGGQLTIDNGGNPVAIVVSGTGHAIDDKVTIVLDSDLWVAVQGSEDSLAIAGNIDDGAATHGLVKNGPGTLILSGDNTYIGGTTVDGGTLVVASDDAIPAGTGLTVGTDGTSLFAPSMSASPVKASPNDPDASTVAVPEPGAFQLLLGGALVLAFLAYASGYSARRGNI
jgi:autotransporter-associated beta strand protein